MSTVTMNSPVSSRRSTSIAGAQRRVPSVNTGVSRAEVGPRADARTQASVRLTRRGRIVVRLFSVLLTALVGAGFLTLATGSDVSASSSTSTYIVQPGDTLWAIAGRLAPVSDRRDTVATLLRLNPEANGGVSAGQSLHVPR